MCRAKAIENCEAHSVTLSLFFLNQEFLRTSVYDVYGSQNEFVDSVTRVFILRMRSFGQNGPLRRDAIFAVAKIAKLEFSQSQIVFHHIPHVTITVISWTAFLQLIAK